MNIAAIFAMLLQTHICASTTFQKPDGTQLTVLTCPFEQPADKAAGTDDPNKGPPKPGQEDN